jgi:hypothetical protein
VFHGTDFPPEAKYAQKGNGVSLGSVTKSCCRQKLIGWAASYRQAQRSGQRDVEFAQLIGTKVSDEVGQPILFQANKSIAMNTAVMLKSHGRADSYLGRKALPLAEYRRADDRGIS